MVGACYERETVCEGLRVRFSEECQVCGGGKRDDEDRESVAILASKDPVFAAAVERRVPLARLENLATPQARLENLATCVRLESLATPAGLLALDSVARIILATVREAIESWIAVVGAFDRRPLDEMAYPCFPNKREIVCNNRDDFVREVQLFLGPRFHFQITQISIAS